MAFSSHEHCCNIMDCQASKGGIQSYLDSCLAKNKHTCALKGYFCILRTDNAQRCQKVSKSE